MLIEVFEDHNRKVATLAGREYATSTVARYETSLKHTKDFMKWKYKINDIQVNKIDHRFISEFEFFTCGPNGSVTITQL